jgi:hypothetical protein
MKYHFVLINDSRIRFTEAEPTKVYKWVTTLLVRRGDRTTARLHVDGCYFGCCDDVSTPEVFGVLLNMLE